MSHYLLKQRAQAALESSNRPIALNESSREFLRLINVDAQTVVDLIEALENIASQEHFEECELSALDYGETPDPGAFCTCCESCSAAKETAIKALEGAK